jgi:hypothetical protein
MLHRLEKVSKEDEEPKASSSSVSLGARDIKWTWDLVRAFCGQCRLEVEQIEQVYQAVPVQMVTMPLVCQLTLEIMQGTEQQLKHAIQLVQKRTPLLRARCVQFEDKYFLFITKGDLLMHEELGSLQEYRLFDQRSFAKLGTSLCRLALIKEDKATFLVITLVSIFALLIFLMANAVEVACDRGSADTRSSA